jgi:uncharacterized protein HemX
MSEETRDRETADAGTEEAVSAEASIDEARARQGAATEEMPQESQQAPGKGQEAAKTAAQPRRGTSPVSWLALFLALLTLAAVGYMTVEERRTRAVEEASGESFDRLSNRIDESQESLSRLDDSVGELVSNDEALESRVVVLQRELEQRADMLDSLPGRMSNLENSVAAMQGASAGARDTWLLAEAEYYMQIANAQLQLGNNPRLAMLALEMADDGEPGAYRREARAGGRTGGIGGNGKTRPRGRDTDAGEPCPRGRLVAAAGGERQVRPGRRHAR